MGQSGRPIQVDLSAVCRIRAGGQEHELDHRLVTLLAAIADTGKLTSAAALAGISHRHAHNLVIRWGRFLGAPLVVMKQGRGSRLTPLGESVLWAGQRVHTRLVPELESLAADVARSVNRKLGRPGATLVVHASHDFAVALLRDRFRAQGGDLDLQNRSCVAALDSFVAGGCTIAGCHIAEGEAGRAMARRCLERLEGTDARLFPLARRRQGLIVAHGNPRHIRGVCDLGRPGTRIVNRQPGSGTRELFDQLLADANVDRSSLHGYATEEITHSAVATLVAGHVADAGLGIEAAAARFSLGFIPIIEERYFLVVREAAVERDEVRLLLEIAGAPAFAAEIDRIPGYQALRAERLATVAEVLGDANSVASG